MQIVNLPSDVLGEIYSYLSIYDLNAWCKATKKSFPEAFRLGKKHFLLTCKNPLPDALTHQPSSFHFTCMHILPHLHYMFPYKAYLSCSPKWLIQEWIYICCIVKMEGSEHLVHLIFSLFGAKTVLDHLKTSPDDFFHFMMYFQRIFLKVHPLDYIHLKSEVAKTIMDLLESQYKLRPCHVKKILKMFRKHPSISSTITKNQ
jgi:hypothetical protein